MRKRARICPMPGCGVRMTDKPHLPNSKELDHIIPVNPLCNGTHTHGNVRIICRQCNQKRPKDGSDYAGPVTLWAQMPGVISRKRTTCRAGLHPYVKGRCKPCGQAAPKQCKCGALFQAPGNQFMCAACIDATAHKAAELHAQGGLTWDQVAAQVGYSSDWGAAYAARRIGYVPGPAVRTRGKDPAQAAPAARPAGPACSRCGDPAAEARGRGKPTCRPCRDSLAWQAVAMRTEQGLTLRAIADQIGYDSITSVTNLMKTVVDIESKMGRPPAYAQVRER